MKAVCTEELGARKRRREGVGGWEWLGRSFGRGKRPGFPAGGLFSSYDQRLHCPAFRTFFILLDLFCLLFFWLLMGLCVCSRLDRWHSFHVLAKKRKEGGLHADWDRHFCSDPFLTTGFAVSILLSSLAWGLSGQGPFLRLGIQLAFVLGLGLVYCGGRCWI